MDRPLERESNASRAIFGIGLMIVGVVLLLGKLDVLEIGPLWRWYPLILVTMGIAKIWQTWGTLAAGSGAWLVMTGLWLLGVNFRILGMTYANSFPALLVAIGGSIIFRSLYGGARGREVENGK